MLWVASTLHTTSEHAVSSITTADAHNSAASSRLKWRPPAYLNGLVRLAAKKKCGLLLVCHHISNAVYHMTKYCSGHKGGDVKIIRWIYIYIHMGCVAQSVYGLRYGLNGPGSDPSV